ncbi:HAMP domain-containing histidine kinase [Staphylococcus gallinarum]|uniref:sensor histidine kinase n=1 Tax=Staphylococcus gallinarum TaxID=1293 RepID=UPI001E3781C2|nr:HAMP domain-containing sensor histidine kinase [Staphylococcus gallinarum]MCD8900104.1 HAMP domain-containing histidine kinase [Staphylococcus gallinarum]MCD8903324.1 HAMP domain-containing histidine kinase [Staphylococcus gallinarum]
MFRSLYTRIAIYTIVVMILSAIISFFITNIIYHNTLKANNDAKIMRTLKDAKSFQQDANMSNLKPYFKHLGEMNYQIMTVSSSGEKHFYGERFRTDNVSTQAIKDVLDGKAYHGIKHLPYNPIVTGFFDNTTKNTVGVQFKSHKQHLAVFMRPDIGKTFGEFRIFLAILISLLLFISIILTITSTYSIIKPVQQLKRATEYLMNGDFSKPIRITRHDELGTLQYRFETMRQSLKQLDDMRQYFVQNVSHEIKTPLTHIHHLLDQLKHSKDHETANHYIDEIHQITTRLSDLTKALLLLSELDNAEHLTFTDTIQLKDLLQNIIRHEQFSANQKELMIMTELATVALIGNERLLHQAFQNIITNAIKYSHQHGVIEINLTSTQDEIICSITDEGEGMSLETQERLFERFFKVRSNDNSNGLGMAITKAIIELHDGTIKVDSKPQIGTSFTISLPRNNTRHTD